MEFCMFDKLKLFVSKYIVVIILGLIIGHFSYTTYNDFVNPPELKEFKGSIQNHLVWNNQKECYFVRPYNGTTVYLIRVPDCDKP